MIELGRCNCDDCYKLLREYLIKHDPEFIEFADKFRTRWMGLVTGLNDEEVKLE